MSNNKEDLYNINKIPTSEEEKLEITIESIENLTNLRDALLEKSTDSENLRKLQEKVIDSESKMGEIKRSIYEKKVLNISDILSNDLQALSFPAAFVQPVSINFWSQNSNVTVEILEEICQRYDLPLTSDGKVIPIEIPNLDLVDAHKAIATRGLDFRKNRKN